MTVPPISGTTRLYAVLGDPVTQVKAPGLVNPLFAAEEVDAVLVPVHVRPDRLGEVIAGLTVMANVDGLLVTVPHKIAVCRYADRLAPAAVVAGSANALRREPDGGWLADNVDGVRFVRGLRAAGHDPAGRRVALVGAGGAGGAIAAALVDAGVARLRISDTDRVRRDELVSRTNSRRPGSAVGVDEPPGGDVDLAVNATPLGLRDDDPLPFSPESLPRDCVVADIIMAPERTRLLREAEGAGRHVHPGIHMLRFQLDSYRAFFGF
ncbi:shikimate dehydrogenase [Micromonospora sp. WMMD1102]|uniref:shikimate dehydrogenase family protein n=1 Tax=Micromonospora sp. WMMD1102 TaxID=3016105 RepID=UPI00241579A8|nr:ThiF family adenylyltransferase [Micromonospora sp. WMMD1102]MDG4786293.1 shikimate dehydrogenase [Micromonospora sp. WMMD1102]